MRSWASRFRIGWIETWEQPGCGSDVDPMSLIFSGVLRESIIGTKKAWRWEVAALFGNGIISSRRSTEFGGTASWRSENEGLTEVSAKGPEILMRSTPVCAFGANIRTRCAGSHSDRFVIFIMKRIFIHWPNTRFSKPWTAFIGNCTFQKSWL